MTTALNLCHIIDSELVSLRIEREYAIAALTPVGTLRLGEVPPNSEFTITRAIQVLPTGLPR